MHSLILQMGMWNGIAIPENRLAVSIGLNIYVSHNPEIPLLGGIYHKEIKFAMHE